MVVLINLTAELAKLKTLQGLTPHAIPMILEGTATFA